MIIVVYTHNYTKRTVPPVKLRLANFTEAEADSQAEQRIAAHTPTV